MADSGIEEALFAVSPCLEVSQGWILFVAEEEKGGAEMYRCRIQTCVSEVERLMYLESYILLQAVRRPAPQPLLPPVTRDRTRARLDVADLRK